MTKTAKNNSAPPTIMVVFGATGDLMQKKIAPSLFHLFFSRQLPKRFKVVGFSRQELSDKDFRERIEELLKKQRDFAKKPKNFRSFCRMFSYVPGFFQKKPDYENLKTGLDKIDENWGMCSNKLFYLAVPPGLYDNILKNLSATKLTEPCGGDKGWSRVIVEKPFGKNLKTAKTLEQMLSSLLKEEQIYRIDHYLAKEMLQNILAFRFFNNLFEGVWGNQLIEGIVIRLHEKLGVEKRGAFYDGVGALRDVGQNHLLQMLALTTMEHPGEFEPDSIRKRRAEILKTLVPPTQKEIVTQSQRAQYSGYKKIKGVAPNSKTETFFRINAKLDSPRWRGVSITLQSGKRLSYPLKEVEIVFKHSSPCLCPPESGRHFKNMLTIQIEPKEGITIRFWSKKPGLKMELEERTFDFRFRYDRARSQYTEEYEKLLLDCIAGDQTLFVSSTEIHEMWRFTDPVLVAWQKDLVPLKSYKPDTNEIVEIAEKLTAGISARPLKKEIGLVGLGKMGSGLARRLVDNGYQVYAFDPDKKAREAIAGSGAIPSDSAGALVKKLKPPRLIWTMVPHGAVPKVIKQLLPNLKKGDTVIDGGNSFYKDSVKRAELLGKKGINFLDVGVSGGPHGAVTGSCLMVGGEQRIYKKYEPLFHDLAAPGGYGYMGKSGSGHFVKMVHNGIEYGMMQSLAEGFTVLRTAEIGGLNADKRGKLKYKFDLEKIADVYNHRSVIESRLTGWLKDAYQKYGEELKKVSGRAAHTGEGRWTVEVAKKLGVPVPIIKGALKFRVESAKKPSYTGKILSVLRNQFGGHDIK